ncbi:MAG TPA: hypothetical protein PLF84_15295 [Bryobacteraceae bacterium]|nr:hypothetical protein [Bryobacterales bacterium]HRJ20413.1 hypothetical protein [Bryobacteraceae bacterium]
MSLELEANRGAVSLAAESFGSGSPEHLAALSALADLESGPARMAALRSLERLRVDMAPALARLQYGRKAEGAT